MKTFILKEASSVFLLHSFCSSSYPFPAPQPRVAAVITPTSSLSCRLTLWRSGSSSAAYSEAHGVRVEPLAPVGIATRVTLTGKTFSSASPANPYLCPGLDVPDGVRMVNLLSVPLQSEGAAGGGAAGGSSGARPAEGAVQAVNKKGGFSQWDRHALAMVAHETLVGEEK